jgi:transcriptional repressor NrdR
MCFPLEILLVVCQYIAMFCINCFHIRTQVTNSRAKKKQALIWRRRRCEACGTIFTTYERPSLTEGTAIYLPSGKTQGFNLGKLILSVARSFTHSPNSAELYSLPLAQSVENLLLTQTKVITPEEIAATTHTVLKRFDELAALQYAAQHHLIASRQKRRGRPATSWRE